MLNKIDFLLQWHCLIEHVNLKLYAYQLIMTCLNGYINHVNLCNMSCFLCRGLIWLMTKSFFSQFNLIFGYWRDTIMSFQQKYSPFSSYWFDLVMSWALKLDKHNFFGHFENFLFFILIYLQLIMMISLKNYLYFPVFLYYFCYNHFHLFSPPFSLFSVICS